MTSKTEKIHQIFLKNGLFVLLLGIHTLANAVTPGDFQNVDNAGDFAVGSIMITSNDPSGVINPGQNITITVPYTAVYDPSLNPNAVIGLNIQGPVVPGPFVSFRNCVDFGFRSFIGERTKNITFSVTIPTWVVPGNYEMYAFATPYYCGSFGFQYLWSNIVSAPLNIGEVLNLKVDSIKVTPNKLAGDSNPTVVPDTVFNVEVGVSGTVGANEARSTDVTLSVAGQTLSKSVNLSSLKGGAISTVLFPNIKISDQFVGEQKMIAIVNQSGGVTEAKLDDNKLEKKLHVLCDVANKGVTVPFFSQKDPEWGNKAYGPLKSDTFRVSGCYLTDVVMMYRALGLVNTVGRKSMNPLTLNADFMSRYLYDVRNGQYSEYTGFTPNGLIQPLAVQAYSQEVAKYQCLSEGKGLPLCALSSLSSVKYLTKGAALDEAGKKAVNSQICAGMPVILEVPSASAGGSHFVLAKSMVVGPDGKYGYKTNNPGHTSASTGQDQERYLGTQSIKGYRLYGKKSPTVAQMQLRSLASQSHDGKLFFHINSDMSMIVTDPQGKRVGSNLITGQRYSEIADAVYNENEFISNEEEVNAKPSPETSLEISSPIPGNYNVQVFSSKNGTYTVATYGSDQEGNLNLAQKKTGSVSAGKSVSFSTVYDVVPQQVKYSELMIRHASFFDTSRKDFAYIKGKLNPTLGTDIYRVESGILIKIGTFSKFIPYKKLLKLKISKTNVYMYAEIGKNAMALELVEKTGEFAVYILNSNLNKEEFNSLVPVEFAVDNNQAASMVKFKCLAKGCIDK